jgi:hypothetical protein
MKSKQPRGKYELIHNPGYDFRRLIYWMKDLEIDEKDENMPIAPYFIPVLALIGACFAIEGYINMVGQHVDQNWQNFEKGPISIRKRVERIYLMLDKQLELGHGIWQQVLNLFKFRIELVHPKYVSKTEVRKTEILTVFDRVEQKYPVLKSEKICDEAIDVLLADASLSHLKNQWSMGGYSGPPRK